MTVLLDLPGMSGNATGLFVAGTGSERQILVTASDFNTGAVTFELSRTIGLMPPASSIALATNLDGLVLSIDSNRAVNIGPIPVGLQLRAIFTDTGGNAMDVRVDIF